MRSAPQGPQQHSLCSGFSPKAFSGFGYSAAEENPDQEIDFRYVRYSRDARRSPEPLLGPTFLMFSMSATVSIVAVALITSRIALMMITDRPA